MFGATLMFFFLISHFYCFSALSEGIPVAHSAYFPLTSLVYFSSTGKGNYMCMVFCDMVAKGVSVFQCWQVLVCLSDMRGHCGMKNFHQLMAPSGGWGGALLRQGHTKTLWNTMSLSAGLKTHGANSVVEKTFLVWCRKAVLCLPNFYQTCLHSPVWIM